MTSIYLLARFTKILAVAALFAGSTGAFLPRDLADRRRFANWLAGPGFIVSWGTGFWLAYMTSASLFSIWILVSMALSLLSLQVVMYSVAKEGRRTITAALLTIVPLIATLALMVWRPH